MDYDKKEYIRNLIEESKYIFLLSDLPQKKSKLKIQMGFFNLKKLHTLEISANLRSKPYFIMLAIFVAYFYFLCL